MLGTRSMGVCQQGDGEGIVGGGTGHVGPVEETPRGTVCVAQPPWSGGQ